MAASVAGRHRVMTTCRIAAAARDALDDDADTGSRDRRRRRSEAASHRSTYAADDQLSDFVCGTGAAWRIQHTAVSHSHTQTHTSGHCLKQQNIYDINTRRTKTAAFYCNCVCVSYAVCH